MNKNTKLFYPSAFSISGEPEEEYPISCETCGDQIFDEEDDFNGMHEECYDTPPDDV